MATISIKNLGFQPIVEKKSGEKSTFFSKGDTYFGEYQPYRQNFNFSTFFCNKQLIEKTDVKMVSFTRFFPLMILEIAKPTKSQTQVSMAHVPTTKSKT